MPTRIEVLEAEVLSLSPDDRSRLLERLIASLDADPDIQESWIEEAQRREAQVAEGTVSFVTGDEVVARLRAGLR